MKKIIFASFLAVIFCAVNYAQTPTPTPVEDDLIVISTSLIQIDVTVTDKKGRIVTDLKPEDFEVYENDKKQDITNFSFVSSVPETNNSPVQKTNKNSAGIPIPPVQIRPEQVRRTIALVVDDLGLSYESIYQVRRALKKFVDEQMQPNDLVAVIRTGGGTGSLQQFTSDKNILYAAIEKVRWNPIGRAGISAFAAVEPTLQEQIAANGATPRTNTTETTESNIQAEKDRMTAFSELREDIFSVGTLGAINYVVKGMNELPGRKSIMLFSDGFSICTDTDMRKDAGRCDQMRDALQRLTDLSNRAAVTIYTQDARGLTYVGMSAQDNISLTTQKLEEQIGNRTKELRDKQQGLSFLADETGGRAVFNNNDLNLGLEKMLEDTKGFYLLGYEPDSETFDPKTRRFNKLTIKVKNEDLTVRYRSGFFGVTDADVKRADAKNETPLQQILKPLTSPFTVNEINLKLNTLFGNDNKNGAFIQSFLYVDAKDLKFSDAPNNSKQATIDILAISYGENGAIVEQVGQNYSITVKNDKYQKLLDEGFVYNFVFPIKKPGAYQMRVSLRDATSTKVGSASQFLDVPDLKKNNLTLSGIVLENLTEADWKAQGAAEKQTTAMMDTSLRRFKKGTILRYNTEIYNAKIDQTKKAQLQTQIRIFRDGKLILDGKQNPLQTNENGKSNQFSFAGAIALGTEMPAGDYVLQIVVTDNLAKSKQKLATNWVQFELTE